MKSRSSGAAPARWISLILAAAFVAGLFAVHNRRVHAQSRRIGTVFNWKPKYNVAYAQLS